MKLRKFKLVSTALIAAVFFALPILVTQNSVSAVGEGQVEGGDIYRVKNLTKGGDFTDPVGADPCQTLQYKVRIHNPGPSPISNVNVKVNLPATKATTNVSSVTVSASDSFPASTSDTATVNLSQAEVIKYVSGSTKLLDANSGFISNLPDGITSGGSGVNIGNVGVSIDNKRFVQFDAKIDCPTKPPCEENPSLPECQPPKPCNPEKEQCAPAVPPQEQTPTSLPDTGPGAIVATFLGVSSLSSAIYYAVSRRF